MVCCCDVCRWICVGGNRCRLSVLSCLGADEGFQLLLLLLASERIFVQMSAHVTMHVTCCWCCRFHRRQVNRGQVEWVNASRAEEAISEKGDRLKIRSLR